MTDGAGNFTLPVYWGAVAGQYGLSPAGFDQWYGAEMADGARLVLKRREAEAAREPAPLKNVTVLLVNEKGERVEGLRITARAAFSAKGQLFTSSGTSAVLDVHGGHFFLARDATSLELEIAGQGWTTMKRTVELQGSEDQRAVVTADEKLRMKPLNGRVASRPPSPVSFSPPVRARSVSSRRTCSSAADSSAPAWSRSSVTSVTSVSFRLGSYTV